MGKWKYNLNPAAASYVDHLVQVVMLGIGCDCDDGKDKEDGD
jgi:hypothetical protein